MQDVETIAKGLTKAFLAASLSVALAGCDRTPLVTGDFIDSKGSCWRYDERTLFEKRIRMVPVDECLAVRDYIMKEQSNG